MKQLLTLLFAIVSFAGFSQYKNMNQKLNFVNGMKISDTLIFNPAALTGSGNYLKIQDTSAGDWRVIRSEIDATDTSFFNRSGSTITTKTDGDNLTIGTASNTGNLTVNGVFRNPVDTGVIDNPPSSIKDTIYLGGNSNVEFIRYTIPSGGYRMDINGLKNYTVGTVITLIAGEIIPVDSAAVINDSAPFYLNGNDTLKPFESITLFINDEDEFIEVSRSDNNN